MKGNCEPLALPEALGSGKTRITGPREGIAAFRPNPLLAAQFQELPSWVTASEMKTDKGRLWGKKNPVFFNNALLLKLHLLLLSALYMPKSSSQLFHATPCLPAVNMPEEPLSPSARPGKSHILPS